MTFAGIAHKVRTPLVIVPILVVLPLALASVWFLNTFEKKPFEVQRGMSLAARTNPLLASQRYVQASGRPAESLQGMELFTNLPSPGDAILIRRLPLGLSQSITDSLYDWVAAGGHLLLVPNPMGKHHPGAGNLLDKLGVRLQENDDSSDCGCPPDPEEDDLNTNTDQDQAPVAEEIPATDVDEKDDDDDGYHPYNRITDLIVDGFPIQLQFFGTTLLEDTNNAATYRIEGTFHMEYSEESDKNRLDNHKEIKQDGAWLLQYTIGAGTVTVLSETTLFHNSNIGERDHAFFLSWLLRDADKIWLLYASTMEPLSAIVWNSMPYFWISLIILTVLIIWRLQKRSGTVLQPPSANRRNILAHIEATGEYAWRMNKSSAMIATNRKAVLQWWAGHKLGQRPDLENKDIDAAALAARSGISEQELHDAFRLKVDHEQHLIQTSRALQKIETLIQGGETNQNDR